MKRIEFFAYVAMVGCGITLGWVLSGLFGDWIILPAGIITLVGLIGFNFGSKKLAG